MKILVINTGSSSIKYELFDMESRAPLARGLLERIGETGGKLTHHARQSDGEVTETVRDESAGDHRQAMGKVSDILSETQAITDARQLFGVGHRVVHGGEEFAQPTLIDQEVLAAIRRQAPLAPLHNPANLIGIEAALAEYPRAPQVAVFDTAFHQTLPPRAYRYALPQSLYDERRIRRYGFHGTSHQYVSGRAAEHLGRPPGGLNMIILHLGNGASAAAVQGGQSIDTSMGLTPLEGLMMGTRCGDLDPAVALHLAKAGHQSIDEIDSLLNKESGLKGICGVNDMREVLRRASQGDGQAELAIDMYCYRIKKYIGAYFAALGRLDAVVFTGGIGENAGTIRWRACEYLDHLGIVLDEAKNAQAGQSARNIEAASSQVKILVVPTDEELEIAEQTVQCIKAAKPSEV